MLRADFTKARYLLAIFAVATLFAGCGMEEGEEGNADGPDQVTSSATAVSTTISASDDVAFNVPHSSATVVHADVEFRLNDVAVMASDGPGSRMVVNIGSKANLVESGVVARQIFNWGPDCESQIHLHAPGRQPLRLEHRASDRYCPTWTTSGGSGWPAEFSTDLGAWQFSADGPKPEDFEQAWLVIRETDGVEPAVLPFSGEAPPDEIASLSTPSGEGGSGCCCLEPDLSFEVREATFTHNSNFPHHLIDRDRVRLPAAPREGYGWVRIELFLEVNSLICEAVVVRKDRELHLVADGDALEPVGYLGNPRIGPTGTIDLLFEVPLNVESLILRVGPHSAVGPEEWPIAVAAIEISR